MTSSSDVILRTADLCDDFPDVVRILKPGFVGFGGREAFFGPAFTISCRNDNSRLREAVAEPGGGGVLVVDGGGSSQRALLGGNLAAKAAENGWSGFVIDGAVRDAHELEAIDVGALARFSCPLRPLNDGGGERAIEIRVGGQIVRPGDMIYADRDGVICADRTLHRN